MFPQTSEQCTSSPLYLGHIRSRNAEKFQVVSVTSLPVQLSQQVARLTAVSRGFAISLSTVMHYLFYGVAEKHGVGHFRLQVCHYVELAM